MTRQRIRVSLLDSMSEECPTCHGSGRIISQKTLVTRIDHWLRGIKADIAHKASVGTTPQNAEYLGGEKKHVLRGLMWQNFVHLIENSRQDGTIPQNQGWKRCNG